MYRPYAIWAAIFGASAVLLGAFGAHALKASLTPISMDAYRTAVWYQFIHALLLLFMSHLNHTNGIIKRAGTILIAGILCFSGSIYFLSTISLHRLPVEWMGPITPIGGICFFISWVLLMVFFWQKPSE